MRARRHTALTVAAIAALAAGWGAPASVNAYPPQPPGPGGRSLDVTAFSPECISDAPYINYAIVPIGFTSTGPADLTIRDINGDIVEELVVDELTGRLVYPGAAVSSNGTAIDWPGWKLENGKWLRDPSDAYLRDGLTITVEVNPIAVATVTYPGASSDCADPNSAASPPTVSAASGPLPSTGSNSLAALRVAAGTLAAGLAIVGMLRLRGRRSHV